VAAPRASPTASRSASGRCRGSSPATNCTIWPCCASVTASARSFTESFAEAEQVYREDLEHHPENGWSLHGLAECLRRRGVASEEAAVAARFAAAWGHGGVPIDTSCFCRRRD